MKNVNDFILSSNQQGDGNLDDCHPLLNSYLDVLSFNRLRCA